jgi:dTDP-4-dehydrorhamnose 3,5-epimerase
MKKYINMTIVNKVENGPVLICPDIHKDDRGYFYESFNDKEFREKVCDTTFVQDNQSCSSLGVLRGMHFQKGEYAQAKLVRVVKGAVVDVVMDIREDSPNKGKVYGYLLTENNHYQLFVPRGFAHGFLTLSESTIFQYKCDNPYNKESEGSYCYDSIPFDWSAYLNPSCFIVSEKDKNAKKYDNGQYVFEIPKETILEAINSSVTKILDDALKGAVTPPNTFHPIDQEIFADIDTRGKIEKVKLKEVSPIICTLDSFMPVRKIIVKVLDSNQEFALSNDLHEVIRFYKYKKDV